jgi:hypothetical protein
VVLIVWIKEKEKAKKSRAKNGRPCRPGGQHQMGTYFFALDFFARFF